MQRYSSWSEDERFPVVPLLASLYFMSLVHLKMSIAWSEFFPQGQQFIPDSGFLFLFIHQSHPSFTLSQKQDAKNDKRVKLPPPTLWEGMLAFRDWRRLNVLRKKDKLEYVFVFIAEALRPPWSGGVGLGWMISSLMRTDMLKMSRDQAEVSYYRATRFLLWIFVCLYIIERDQIWEQVRSRFSLSYKTVNLKLPVPWFLSNATQIIRGRPKDVNHPSTCSIDYFRLWGGWGRGARYPTYQWGSNSTFSPYHGSQKTHLMHKHRLLLERSGLALMTFNRAWCDIRGYFICR